MRKAHILLALGVPFVTTTFLVVAATPALADGNGTKAPVGSGKVAKEPKFVYYRPTFSWLYSDTDRSIYFYYDLSEPVLRYRVRCYEKEFYRPPRTKMGRALDVHRIECLNRLGPCHSSSLSSTSTLPTARPSTTIAAFEFVCSRMERFIHPRTIVPSGETTTALGHRASMS